VGWPIHGGEIGVVEVEVDDDDDDDDVIEVMKG